MNIYLLQKKKIKRLETNDFCIVVAKTAKSAKNIHPVDGTIYSKKSNKNSWWSVSTKWNNPDKIRATLVGKALDSQKENSVICAAF